jgi:hypothetical protein
MLQKPYCCRLGSAKIQNPRPNRIGIFTKRLVGVEARAYQRTSLSIAS